MWSSTLSEGDIQSFKRLRLNNPDAIFEQTSEIYEANCRSAALTQTDQESTVGGHTPYSPAEFIQQQFQPEPISNF